MAANNDFFVNFDSNATTFARKLNSDLEPARKVINDFRALLATVDQPSPNAKRSRAEIAKDAARRGSGSGGSGGGGSEGGGHGRDASREQALLNDALYAQVAEVKALTSSLALAKTGIDSTVTAIEKVPGQLKSSFASISASLRNIAEQSGGQGGGGRHYLPENPQRMVKAGTPGALQYGTSESAVSLMVGRAMAQKGGFAVAPPSLPSAKISSADTTARAVDRAAWRANTERIIGAIQFQTRTLAARLNDPRPPSGRAPANPVSGPGPQRPTAAPAAEKTRAAAEETKVGKAAAAARAEAAKTLADADKRIAKIMKDMGDKLGPVEREIIKELEGMRSAAATALANAEKQLDGISASLSAKKERKDSGVSKADQKAARQAAFKAEQAAKPKITDVQLAQNQRDARLLASPADPDFLNQVGRKKGQYSGADLEEMAKTFERFGVGVERTTRTKVPELAKKLQAAGKEYGKLFPEGNPALITDARSANVSKTTQIPESVTELIGAINEAVVIARREAIDTVSLNRRSGGDKINPEDLVNVDRGSNTRGRRQYGAAISTAPSPLARTGTPQDVIDSYRLLGPRPAQQAANARRNAANPGFNPYDTSLTKNVKVGNTQADKDLASAVFAEVRNLRLATAKMDDLGKKYLLLKDALQESENYINRTSAELKQNPGSKSAQRGLHDARGDQDRILAELNKLRVSKSDRALFDSPAYKQGLALRENAPAATAENPNPLSPRAGYESRSAAANTRGTLSAYRDLQQATQDVVIGFKSLFGSKTQITKNLPFIGKTSDGRLTRSDGRITGEQQKDLSISERQLTAAQARTFQLRSSGTANPEDLAKAEQGLDNAAEKFSNNLERIFGTSLPTRTYTGREPVTAELQASERTRQSKRDALETIRKAKPGADATAEQKAAQAKLALANAEIQLARETERQKAASARVTTAENELNAAISKLSKADQAEVRAAQKKAASVQRQIDQIDRSIALGLDAKSDRKGRQEDGNMRPVPLDTLGYPAGTTNAPSAVEERARLVAERQSLNAQLTGKGVKSGVGSATAQNDEIALLGSTKEVERLTAAVEKLRREAAAAEKAVNGEVKAEDAKQKKKKTAAATDGGDKTVTAEVAKAKNEELVALRQKRAAARQEGEYTRTQVAALRKARDAAAVSAKSEQSSRAVVTRFTNNGATDKAEAAQAKLNARLEVAKKAEDAYAAALERKNRIADLSAKIKEIEKANGGSGRGGSGNPPTARGGAEGAGMGPTNTVLRQILAEVKRVNTKLTSGIKTTSTVTTRTAASKATENTAKGGAAATTPEGYPRPFTSQTPGAVQRRPKGFIGPMQGNAPTEEQAEARLAKLQSARAAAEARRARDAKKNAQEQTAAVTQAATAFARSEREIRDEARQAADLENALKRVSRETLHEIELLREMTREIAKAKTEEERTAAVRKAGAQQVRVADAVGADLRAQGVRNAGRRDATRSILNSAGPDLEAGELDSVMRSARGARGFREVGEHNGEQMADGTISRFAEVFGGNTSFLTRTMNTVGTFLVRNFAAGFVFGITGAFQQVIDQAIQAEATFVRVRATLESTGKDLGGVRQGLQSVATDYGTQLNDVYTTAAGLTGIFSNSEDLVAGTRIVSQLQTISGGALNATEATGVLASTLSAFGAQPGIDITDKILPGGIEGVTKVADVLTSIQNNLGVNIETTAEGVSRMSGLAREMKLSFEQTAVFTGQIAKLTNQTGAGAGEQFSRILTSLQSGRGRGAVNQALTSIGGDEGAQATAAFNNALKGGDYGTAIEGLMKNWDKLSDAQKSNLTITIAGQRQAAAFNALFNNSAKTLDALAKAETASGEAGDRMAEIMKTLNNRLARFGSEAQALASNLIQTGILNFLGLVLVVTNETLDVVNKLLNAFNRFADENSFLGFLRTMIGLLVGAGLAVKVFQSTFSGLSKNMAARRAANLAESGIVPAYRPPTPAGGVTPRYDRQGYERSLGYGTRYSTTGISTGRTPYVPTPAGILPTRTQQYLPTQSRGAVLTRAAQNGFDRTAGAAFRGASSGLERFSRALAPANVEVSNTRRALSGFVTGLNALAVSPISRGVTGIGRLGERGGVAGGLGRLSESFNQQAASRARAATDLRGAARLQDQLAALPSARARPVSPGQASLFDRVRGPGRGVGALTGDSAASLTRQARFQDVLSRGAARAADTTSKLSNALTRLGASGGIADGAMLALTITLIAAASAFAKRNRIADENDQAYKSTFGQDRGKSAAQQADEYVGKYTEKFTKRNEEAASQAQRGGFLNTLKSGFSPFGEFVLSGGPLTGQSIEGATLRDQGLQRRKDGYVEQYGATQVDDQFTSKAQAELDKLAKDPKATGDDIRNIQKRYVTKAKEMADQINASDLGENQKQAFLSSIEKAQAQIADNVENLAAMADGAASALAITAEQVQKLQDYATVAGNLQGLQNVQGLDLDKIVKSFAEDAGITDANGDKMNALVNAVGNPDNDPVEQAVANKKLLEESISQLYNQWQSKLQLGQQDEADAIRQQLQGVLQQYGQATDNIVDALFANANLLAQQATNQGDYAGALKISENALIAAKRKMDRQNGPTQTPAGNLPKIGGAVAGFASKLGFGDETTDALSGYLDGAVDQLNAPKAIPQTKADKTRLAKHQAKLTAQFQQLIQQQIAATMADLQLQISAAADAGMRASLQAQYDALVASGYKALDNGQAAFGISPGAAAAFGPDAVGPTDLNSTQATANQSALANAQSQRDAANTARQNAAQIKQAQIGVQQAYADARGDQVASAQAQVAAAKAAIAAGQADLAAAAAMAAGAARNQAMAQAKVAILGAQAQLIAAQASVQQAQNDLVQSQYQVTIALADAAGRTVDSARASLGAARAALSAAMKKSGGKATAEVNAAKAAAITAEAALRDAKLQDSLDTIDFNLQMGKITQSSAIAALQEILKTNDLTKAQRRQLLLQIKGMKDEIADSQFNFGNIKLPTPYEMRRYAKQQLLDMTGQTEGGAAAEARNAARTSSPFAGAGGRGAAAQTVSNTSTTNQTTIQINGADIAKVRRIVEDVVGRPSRTTTSAPRRRIN